MGTSFTFLEKANVRFGIDLVKIFENSGYPVPDELEDLAMLDDGFRRKRISSKMGVSFAKGYTFCYTEKMQLNISTSL